LLDSLLQELKWRFNQKCLISLQRGRNSEIRKVLSEFQWK